MRKLLLVLMVVAALGGTGVAGAIVESNVIVVNPGQWARLGTTGVYCQAYTETPANNSKPAFDCSVWAGNSHVAGTYGAVIDEQGVEIDRWDASGRHVHRVVTDLNP